MLDNLFQLNPFHHLRKVKHPAPKILGAGAGEDGEEEEDEAASKRKPVNFKAFLPYAAVLVFGVALNYTVIRVTNYLQEKKAHKAQWVSRLKADQSEMQGRPKVYRDALEDGANREAFGRLDELSLDELKKFRVRLMQVDRKSVV